MFALGRAGLGPKIGAAHPVHGTPAAAVILTLLLCIGGFVLWAPFAGPANYCAYLLTIGTLALMLVYIGVTAAELAGSFGARRLPWSICGLAGAGVLLWSFYNTLTPAPAFPNNLWPYFVLAWVIGGAALPMIRPALGEKNHE
jgi:amino acid transporter